MITVPFSGFTFWSTHRNGCRKTETVQKLYDQKDLYKNCHIHLSSFLTEGIEPLISLYFLNHKTVNFRMVCYKSG